jgi:hypothetical protein
MTGSESRSTTGADYVEPSAAATLKPGQRVAHDHEAKSRLLCGLDNHFSLYLYGRQIVAGENPGRGTGGANPFMAGLVGEWAAERPASQPLTFAPHKGVALHINR